MAQVINTNIASLNSQRNLNNSQMNLSTALQRLSSGLRINSAKDDAAGLAIADRMTSQVRGLNQAVRNANDAISMAQTADGALSEMGNLLQRIRELSVQSANATNSDSDRSALNSEVTQLKSELSRLAENTTFNGQKILNGAQQSVSFQVGADQGQTIKMSINSSRTQSLGINMKSTDNTKNGMAVATGNYRVDSGSGGATLMGKALTATSAVSTANGYQAQTLTIKDSTGNVVVGGSVGIVAGDNISDVANRLNDISGVRATGSTQMKLTSVVSGLSSDGTATFTATLASGNTVATLNVSGVTTASSQDAVFTALRDAINNDTNLQSAGVVAGINTAGQLVVRNNTGADLGLKVTTTSDTSSVAFLVTGTDVASTAITLTADLAAAGGAVEVGGQLSVYLADGYTISSSAAANASLFNASASSTVTASATNVGIDDAVTNNIASNYVTANSAITAKAQLSSSTVTSNGYSAQTLTIRDATGAKLAGGDSIVITQGASVDTVVAKLNNLSGVQASASSTITVTNIGATTSGYNAFGSNTGFSFAIRQGTTSVNLSVSGLSATSTAMDAFKSMRDAINADTTLAGAGVTASFDSSGQLDIKNTDGKDLGIAMTAGAAAATNTSVQLQVRGSDAANTLLTITSTAIAAGSAVVVGGTLNVTLADGYSIASSVGKTSSYFDVNANAAAATVVSGVNFGTRSDAQTLTITGSSTATVSVAKDSTAEEIANLVNGQTANTGVTATARTQAKLSDISTAGTVTFNMGGASISALVTGSGSTADLSGLAGAINAKSSTTGISARLSDNKASIILEHGDGANISISDFTHSAASAATASNINGTQASFSVSGLATTINQTTGAVDTVKTTAATLYAGGLTNRGADSTVVGGTVTFTGASGFTVGSSDAGSSRAGGNSSVFAADAGVANSSGLFNIASVDISTVDGATAAIGAIDGAMAQLNTLRSAMGALQNRFTSTIASLSTGSDNIAAARSRIQDTDFASETANLTRNQILQQAGVAMLSQANQLPQLVLSLLK